MDSFTLKLIFEFIVGALFALLVSQFFIVIGEMFKVKFLYWLFKGFAYIAFLYFFLMGFLLLIGYEETIAFTTGESFGGKPMHHSVKFTYCYHDKIYNSSEPFDRDTDTKTKNGFYKLRFSPYFPSFCQIDLREEVIPDSATMKQLQQLVSKK